MRVVRFHLKSLTLISILFVSFSSYAAQKTYGDVLVSEVVRVYDGDTFTVNINGYPDIIGKEINVRIDGIDTPELRDKNEDVKQLAEFARDTAGNLLMPARKIMLKNLKRDKYFRLVATVIVNDEIDVSQFLLKEKLAKPYNGGKKDPWTKEDVDVFWARQRGVNKTVNDFDNLKVSENKENFVENKTN